MNFFSSPEPVVQRQNHHTQNVNSRPNVLFFSFIADMQEGNKKGGLILFPVFLATSFSSNRETLVQFISDGRLKC